MKEKALIRNVRGPVPRIFVLAGKFESCVNPLAETGEVVWSLLQEEVQRGDGA